MPTSSHQKQPACEEGAASAVQPGMETATEHAWRMGRCPCCYKHTEIVLGPLCNETARGWSNLHTREASVRLAKAGTCPWCGRQTTIVSKILLGRYEPTLMAHVRAGCWI